MLAFKQAMAFPMFATVAWLVWVLGLQVGMNGVFRLLLAFTLAGAGVWLLGRWGASLTAPRPRRVARGLAVAMLAGAAGLGLHHQTSTTPLRPAPVAIPAEPDSSGIVWEPFSPGRVEALRRAGRPVFIDFTAAWCLSCKVNERVALANDVVRQRLRALDVATLRADWTSSDPTIAGALAAFGRQGVPLYVLYAPHRRDPVILPTLLTPATVLEALTQVLVPQASM
jgi:thiol:disulfide interchange protein DsbD